MARNKPRVHARDHEHGGADPHRLHYEDLEDDGETTVLTSKASKIRWGTGLVATDEGEGVVLINGTAAGGGLVIKGHKPTAGDLPDPGDDDPPETGDTWVVDDTDTTWVWDGTVWVNISGHDVPPGGNPGDVLTKNTEDDWDASWSPNGGRYVSVQDGVFHGSAGTDIEITNWPRITIPMAVWNANVGAGYGLYAQWKAEAKPAGSPFYRIDVQPLSTNLPDDYGSDDPVNDTGWITLNNQGMLLIVSSGATVGSDQSVWMRYQSGVSVDIRNGILVMYWADAIGVPVSFYLGDYPALNSDIAANAAIDPAKLSHPGGTNKFLRSDGTWSDLVLEVEY